MSQTYYTILTKLGAELLANATALGIPLKLTSMAVGDGNGSVPKPTATQTALTNEVRRAAINSLSVDKNNNNQIIAEQVIPENEGGWFIHEIGLFDDRGNLIAVGNCPPTYKPRLAEGSGRTQVIRMIIIIDNINSVELKIDPSVVLATREYVDDKIETRVPQSRKINNKKLDRDVILTADDINALPALKKINAEAPIYEVGELVNFKKRPTFNNSNLISSAEYAAVFTRNGYAKMPNGLILQWGEGQYQAEAQENGYIQSFYTAFPNACLSIVTSDGFAGVNSTAASAVSRTQFRCWCKSPVGAYANTGFFYIAIGF